MRDLSLSSAPAKAALVALAFAAMTAWAAPEPAETDAIAGPLAEKGWLPSEATTPAAQHHFGQRVRDKASDVVLTAMNFLGVRYRRGGASETSGFDCSGFTRHIIETSLGLILPRRADDQASAPGLIAIRRDELKPGDLVFFNTLKRTFSHVGIYVGEGKFIHSPRAGGEVRVEDMGFAYWRKRFTGARRMGALADSAAVPPAGPAAPMPAFATF